MNTYPDVFIIESLDPDDEGNGRLEGTIISHVLRLHQKQPQFRYVRTRDQFAEALQEFESSAYQYLHISAHGHRRGLVTTNLDEITSTELASLLSPSFRGKRLFLSACSLVRQETAASIIPSTGCSSIIGPRTRIGFAEAAVFWPAVYHLMFDEDSGRMTRQRLKACLSSAADLFNVQIGYYAASRSSPTGYSTDILKRRLRLRPDNE
jgi:hypothetical protein